MHPYIAIFELVRPLRPFNRRIMPRKFRDDISNRQTNRQIDRQTNGHWKQYHPGCAGGSNVHADAIVRRALCCAIGPIAGHVCSSQR